MRDDVTPPLHRCGVLGSPISHSRSPQLHRAAYRALDLHGWSYDPYEVRQDELPGFLDRLTPQWRGLSLTMPLKQAIIARLDTISVAARTLQSVNTVVIEWRPDSRTPVLHGSNTDVAGIEAALRSVLPQVGAPMVGAVLGAGATAASAVAALAALGIDDVTVVARRPAQAEQDLGHLAAELGLTMSFRTWDEAAPWVAGSDVVVSTVPAGAADQVATDLDTRSERVQGTLLDVVYDPWPTRLAEVAMRRGGTVVSGLEMLLHQAAAQVEQMTGCRTAPVAQMRAALEG